MILDALQRAGSVIAAHETRMATDIAALRVRQQPSPLVLPEDIPPVPRFVYEEGHAGQKRVWEELGQVIGLPMDTADEALESLARSQQILLENGAAYGPRRFAFEAIFLVRLRELLGKGLDGAPRLRRTATLLGQLEVRRLASADLLLGEHILDRAEILNALGKKDPSLGKPGWRELYSRRILAAKRLNRLDDPSRRPLQEVSELLQEERKNQAQWRLTRAAVAVMIHHREKGSLPGELHGLKLSGTVLQDVEFFLEWSFPAH